MNTISLAATSAGKALNNTDSAGGKITIFHCYNAINNYNIPETDFKVKTIKLPCSGMTTDVLLLKAFEDGADAVIVLACPEQSCRYLQGNLRARKRVERVKKLLDEAGLDGGKLNIYNVNPGDDAAILGIVSRTAAAL